MTRMAFSRSTRKWWRTLVRIYHKIDLLITLVTLGALYFLLQSGEVPWSDFAKFATIGVAALIVCSFFLLRLWRRRLSGGIVGWPKSWSAEHLRRELKEGDGEYWFVGTSFKPYLEAFINSSESRKRRVYLILTDDPGLRGEHLEVVEALEGYDNVKFLTMARTKSWWAHVFNAQDEVNGYMVLGLCPSKEGSPVILELEKIPKQYSLFDHLLSEVREVRDTGNVKPVEIWSRELKRLGNASD